MLVVCLLGESEVTGMLLPLSRFIGKVKLVKLEVEWGFFAFEKEMRHYHFGFRPGSGYDSDYRHLME